MKLLKLATNYPRYLSDFYASQPTLAEAPYEVQRLALEVDGFSWAGAWPRALAPLGYETRELVANAEPLARAWAREQGLSWPGASWLLDIAEAQVAAFKPEVLFLTDYVTFSRDWLRALRTRVPSIRLIIGWCGAPYHDGSVFEAYDLILSCIPEMVEHFRALGHRAEHMNWSFDPTVLERIDRTAPKQYDFTFVGQIVRGKSFHLERERLLEALVERLPLTIFSPGAEHGMKSQLVQQAKGLLFDATHQLMALGASDTMLRRLPVLGKAAAWKDRPLPLVSPLLRRHMRPGVFGRAMYETLHASRLTFNSHIDASPRSASNMRLYEAAGMGACLVTDWKENLHELYEPDREVVTYRSAEECIEKVKYLLEHPEEQQAIARAGQARTVKDHTFSHRAQQLDGLIQSRLRHPAGGSA